MAYRNRGGCICASLTPLVAGLLACATACFAQTNQPARARDDKSALVNLAVQALQQVQAQEQTTLRAVHDTRRELASLRRFTILMAASLAAGMVLLGWYVRALLRRPRPRPLGPVAPHVHADTLLRRAAALERAHQLEESLACYEQVLALDTSLTEAYVGKGRVLNQLERYREALDCFEQAGHVRQ